MINIENITQMTKFEIDDQPHIILNSELCRTCDHHACVNTCPAGCYTLSAATERLDVVYETCLECGTCLVICDKGSVSWGYPRGGYGVNYRLT
jgi:ferredoxin like protein